MLNNREVARLMSEEVGITVNPEVVTKLIDDGTPGHMGSGHWDVYAARCGEFTIFMYFYDETGDYSVQIF